MNQVIEDFMERPLSHKIFFWVASFSLFIFIFWQYVYKSQEQRRKALEDTVAKLESEKTQEQRIARNLTKYKKEVDELNIKFKFALQELPDSKEIPDLLSSISNLARDAGLTVTLFKPNPEVRQEFYAEVPVSVSVEGTYHQVATFFDEVGQLPRIININRIAIHHPAVTDAQVSIKTDCVATTFRYLDESERVAAPQDDNKKKRRR